MTGSSPSDLAVAFRSFSRRAISVRRRADETARRELVEHELTVLDTIVRRSAARLGAAPDNEVIATKIATIAPSEWDSTVLQGLRQDALDAGAALRRAEEIVDR